MFSIQLIVWLCQAMKSKRFPQTCESQCLQQICPLSSLPSHWTLTGIDRQRQSGPWTTRTVSWEHLVTVEILLTVIIFKYFSFEYTEVASLHNIKRAHLHRVYCVLWTQMRRHFHRGRCIHTYINRSTQVHLCTFTLTQNKLPSTQRFSPPLTVN